MDNAEIIARLQDIGPLPDDGTPEIEAFPLEEFNTLLQQITEPLDITHALVIINLGPPANASTFEVEWALVHAAESISAADLRNILPLAESTEVKRITEIRLANYYKNQL